MFFIHFSLFRSRFFPYFIRSEAFDKLNDFANCERICGWICRQYLILDCTPIWIPRVNAHNASVVSWLIIIQVCETFTYLWIRQKRIMKDKPLTTHFKFGLFIFFFSRHQIQKIVNVYVDLSNHQQSWQIYDWKK